MNSILDKQEDSRNQPNKKSEGTLYFGVKFRFFDKVYPIQKIQIPVILNQQVVVETNRGHEFGEIALRKELPNMKQFAGEIVVKRIVRIATLEDVEAYNKLKDEETEAFIQCIKKKHQHNLSVKFFKVEKIFDGHRYIFYYKREEHDNKKDKQNKVKRNNFQPFTLDLSQHLNAKVELREVGSRGEAKLFGGVGDCGKTLCCVDWNKGSAVTVKMAKEQGLSINIPKLSGCCGRLKCCLSYELDNYQDGDFIHG
ncbi:MAG: regulatory iron-sulfur-containing complex subunit RicT [Candidatus Margulisbacteria bacterium]|nr:regulatory iron-sulfur-containing complex subunit RicT [Candidatus Margulisiibacteriota bacterium]